MFNQTLESVSIKIRDHLIAQRAQSKADIRNPNSGKVSSICAYRGADGLMCAVGCLIKDEFYDPQLETKTSDDEDVMSAVNASIGSDYITDHMNDLIKLMDRWQAYHDHRFDEFCYEKWVNPVENSVTDSEVHHPSKFHDFLFPQK